MFEVSSHHHNKWVSLDVVSAFLFDYSEDLKHCIVVPCDGITLFKQFYGSILVLFSFRLELFDLVSNRHLIVVVAVYQIRNYCLQAYQVAIVGFFNRLHRLFPADLTEEYLTQFNLDNSSILISLQLRFLRVF